MNTTPRNPASHEVDARWIMAYGAALGDAGPACTDTAAAGPVTAHPLFPVCLEWPVVLTTSNRNAGTLSAPGGAAVHASHDLHLHRPIRAGDRLTTTGRHVGIEQRDPGVFTTTHMETEDVEGRLVATTWQGALAIGARLESEATASGAPSWPRPEKPFPEAPMATSAIEVREGAAHVYTECARIWNPIHTDRSVALMAGLPDIILHGTATLALAVSRLVAVVADGDASRVRRICGRFAAMVLMPSTLSLRIRARTTGADGEVVFFEVANPDGALAISNGSVTLAP